MSRGDGGGDGDGDADGDGDGDGDGDVDSDCFLMMVIMMMMLMMMMMMGWRPHTHVQTSTPAQGFASYLYTCFAGLSLHVGCRTKAHSTTPENGGRRSRVARGGPSRPRSTASIAGNTNIYKEKKQ